MWHMITLKVTKHVFEKTTGEEESVKLPPLAFLQPGAFLGLKISLNMIGDSEDAHKLLLTDRKISKFCEDFSNVSSANTKISET